MWWRFMIGLSILCSAGGCNQVFDIPDVTQGELGYRVGGNVRGLWDGNDGVVLQLQAVDTDVPLTVAANGAFHFNEVFEPGTSFTVTIARSPKLHTCVVEGGGSGTIADADVSSASIACTGPAVAIAMSDPWGWAFDPTQETQMFTGSIATQAVVLTISGSELDHASVNSTSVMLGSPAPALTLPLGLTNVPVTVSAQSGLSKTYHLGFDRGGAALEQTVFGKASNTERGDTFGHVAISGNTLAISASGESSGATGIDPVGGQADNSASASGAVYVFARVGTTWTQQAYIKASNTGESDLFGVSLALSGDTLAVGASGEASAATGIDPVGGQADNSAHSAGAVYVFVRTGTTWTQQAYLKASNTDASDDFGENLALSGDTLAVAAQGEASAATGINSTAQADNSAYRAGAVYVFARNGATWTQQAYLKASNTEDSDYFGTSVAVSGNTVVVGAPGEDSAAIGVDAADGQADNSAGSSGAAYVFARNGTTWTQQAYLKASNTEHGDAFGQSVAVSGDTVAVGAYEEASGAIGVDAVGGQSDNSALGAGAVYVFVRTGTTWSQQAYLKASNTEAHDVFSIHMAMCGDTLAVAAPQESSGATGVDAAGGQADNTAINAGAVYVFVRTGTTWEQRAYVKASNTDAGDGFGFSLAVSEDTLAIGAAEDSAAVGINPPGGQSDNSAPYAGAVYIFR